MEQKETLGYWPVVAIGVGGMVGGGIFAVLGLAVELSGGGTPVAFAVAGLVALVTSYSYARLSVAFRSQGGTVAFLNQVFGANWFTGGLNILLWISYMVMLSLYAQAFGSYGASFFPLHLQPLWRHILLSAALILLTGLNIVGAKAVGAAETYIVAVKITILLVFAVLGARTINTAALAPGKWTGPLNLVAGGMIIFLAYEGFELIANTARDVRNYRVILPRAYFSAVGFVILLYIAVSAVAVGNLSPHQIAQARDYALAVAARPFLGQFGFTLIAIAAVLSTASAINATFYGAARLSYIIAKEGEAPEWLERKVWRRPVEGLLLTCAATLLLANLVNLSSISVMGSSGFLIIFAVVNVCNAKAAKQTQSTAFISWLGAAVCVLALAALVWQRATTDPLELISLPAMVGLALGVEFLYRKRREKETPASKDEQEQTQT